jgi:hypothetical protein
MANDNNALVDEASFLLSLSQSISKSFATRKKRTPNWFTIAHTATHQTNGEITGKAKERFGKALRKVKTSSRSAKHSHPKMRRMVEEEFKNDEGLFLKPKLAEKVKRTPLKPGQKERGANLQGYVLTQNFTEAAVKYVHAFWDANSARLSLKRLPKKLDTNTALDFLKVMMKVQLKDYLPPWGEFLNGLADVANAKFKLGLLKGDYDILHWIITMVFFQHATLKPDAPLTSDEAYDRVHELYVVTLLEDFTQALKDLSDVKGCRILTVEERSNGIKYYSLTKDYYAPTEAYLQKTILLRPKWQELDQAPPAA